MNLPVFVFTIAAGVLLSASARAETWQAPVGGRTLPIGEGRVVCPGTTGDWMVEQDGHALQPPASDAAIGRAVDVKVAPTAAACTGSGATLTLVATGRFPTIDPEATTLFVDDARVELRGHSLKSALVRWHVGDRSGLDRCVQPQVDMGIERCVVSVGHGLPADPSTTDLDWFSCRRSHRE